MEWIEKIKIEDIPDKHKKIAEKIGVLNFMKLCGKFGNETIHITSPQRLKSRIRRRIIKNEYNGLNAEELAQKYEITIAYVNVLVKGIKNNLESNYIINAVPKNINEWLELLQLEDVTEIDKTIIDTIGMLKYIELCKGFGGKYYSFPIQERVIESKINKKCLY